MDWQFSITSDIQIINSKLIALNGSPTFYRKGQMQLIKMPEKDLIFCFPNPAKNELFINFKIDNEGAKASLKLYDVASRKSVECFDNQQFTSGLHQWRVNTEGLSTGAYIVQLTVSGRLFTKKIIIGK